MKKKTLLLLAASFWAVPGLAVDKEFTQKNQFISIKLIPRTGSQMAAFYEARGFPRNAILEIQKTCFITVIIRNHSQDTVWLELANWQFGLPRLDRKYWKDTWQKLDVPKANQSTFTWTQLPEVRDLRPDEPVGGNIVLQREKKAFSVEAKFAVGPNKNKASFSLKLSGVQCAEDPH